MDRWMNKGNISIIVEAVQLTSENIAEVQQWTKGKIIEERDPISNRLYDSMNVPTLKGIVRAQVGQYIVKHGGSFYVSSRSTFEKNYARINEPKTQPGLKIDIPVTQDPRDSKILGKFNGPPWFDGRKE